jgi:hypothetical protein
VDVRELGFVEVALFAELRISWLDFTFSLGFFEGGFDVVTDAVGDGFACAWRGSGWAEGVVCEVCV